MVVTLTPEMQKALDRAKLDLMAAENMTFILTVLFSLPLIWRYEIPTACTDGTCIELNPDFFMSLTPNQRVFLLLHETWHVAFMHMDRLGDRDPERQNVAGDHVINLMLLKQGFDMPPNGYADWQYDGMSTEEVYNLLPVTPPNFVSDLREPTDTKVMQEQVRDIIVRASVQASVAGDSAGNIPGELQIFLDKLLNPKLPWTRILQKYLQNTAKSDYTFRKPNRRFFPQHYLPSLYSEGMIDLAVAVDTSASVSDHEFKVFVTEVASILRMMKPEKMTVVPFDAQLHNVTPLNSVKDLLNMSFTGRGGTKIAPVMEWAKENKPKLLLVFSDGGFRFPLDIHQPHVIWVIHNNTHFAAPFGKVIHYTVGE